jgi:1-acyl-sn-glycerol-3-phosphate acyltransferase
VPVLYDTVALGMAAYTRTAFRVQTLGREDFRLRPGTLILVTHRRDTDVPVLCPSIYRHGELWRDRSARVSFAAREDLFEPGFFAGFPPKLPLVLRRVVYPIAIGDILEETLQVHPLRSASLIRLNDVFRSAPELELADGLPPDIASSFRARACELGLPQPERGRDVLRGEYADLLWRTYNARELDGDALRIAWAHRRAEALDDFRTLVGLVRRGAIVVLFPEGRPSPDGAVGPLQAGLGALVRRARPRWIQPTGISYDPLVRGRTRVTVCFAPAVPTPTEDVEATILRLLRRAVPLTVGQVVASCVSAGETEAAAMERTLEEDLAAARSTGRRAEPAVERREARRALIREALAVAADREPDVAYLARERASIRLGDG